MNEREHAVLSLFYDEGNREVTPSFLAYRMRMSTRDATALLDDMVKHGTLDLDIDDEGHLRYRLPDSERKRIEESRRRRPSASFDSVDERSSRDSSPSESRPFVRTQNPSPHHRSSPSSKGTDAAPGYDGQRSSSQPTGPAVSQRQSAHDGTDGTLYPTTSSSSATTHSPVWGTPSQDHEAEGFDADEWYQSQPKPHRQPPTATKNPSPRGHDQPPRPSAYASNDRYGTVPERQALTPYQSAEHHPARTDGRQRIPVLAGALSLLVPGLGQFYNGEIGKGIMLLFSFLLLSVFMLFWIVWIWSVIDAYMVAEQSNQRTLEDDSSRPPLLPDQRPPTSTPNSNAA